MLLQSLSISTRRVPNAIIVEYFGYFDMQHSGSLGARLPAHTKQLAYATCPIKPIHTHRLDEFVRDAVLTEVLRRVNVDLQSLDADSRDHMVREVLRRVTVDTELPLIDPDRAKLNSLGLEAYPARISSWSRAADATRALRTRSTPLSQKTSQRSR